MPTRSVPAPWLLVPGLLILGLLIPGLASPARAGEDARPDAFARLESAILAARAERIDALAPAAFLRAAELYTRLEAARRSGTPVQELSPDIARVAEALDAASRAAGAARQHLAPTLKLRQQVARWDAADVGRGDDLLRRAAARLEAGDAAEATRLARSADLEYSRAGASVLRGTRLREATAALDAARERAEPAFVRRAQAELDATAALLEGDGVHDLAAAESRLEALLDLLFPPFYRRPPRTLTIDGFTIEVEAYTSRQWDLGASRIVHAHGTGWVSFDCRRRMVFPYPGILLSPRKLRVVETVSDPLEEIGLADARRIDPQQAVGAVLELSLPSYAVSASQVSQVVADYARFFPAHRGDVRVAFEDLTIEPGGEPGTGIVVAGLAKYPTVPPEPDPLGLPMAGFRLEVSALTIGVGGALVSGFVEFPRSVVDPGSGHPGRIAVSNLAVTKQCACHEQLAVPFGPWAVGTTEMVLQGSGVTLDFDTGWVAPGVAAASPAAQPAWRGALLGAGTTVPATDPVVSNSGYFRAAYAFGGAEVTAPGLRGRFDLSAPFEFESLQPLGYRVRFEAATLELQDSALGQGSLRQGRIVAPPDAAESAPGQPVRSTFGTLFVDQGLDLIGSAELARPIRWGEYTRTAGRPTYYEARTFVRPRFYLAGTHRSNYFPIGPTGDFVEPLAPLGNPRIDGMQGLTVYMPRELTVFTPDTPSAKQLDFQARDDKTNANWINVSFGGVHARLNGFATAPGSRMDLGPQGKPFYVGVDPFRPSTAPASPPAPPAPPPYRLDVSFVSSAVVRADMSGTLHIPLPADSPLDFDETAFTSTAQISGAKAPFTSPFALSYWGLDMVKKPGASAGAVISVRTGQVFFTAAGIREPRHYAEPFWLIWGEMLANGALKRLVFDYAGVGQRFDGFPFTTGFVRLSDFDPVKPAFLKVAGTVHFDVFGPKYVNVEDRYAPAEPGAPYDGRLIEKLMTDSDPGGAFGPSDLQLAADWSGGFGSMSFGYDYDANAQDGFLGAGQMGFLWVAGTMTSSIVLKHDHICMSVHETQRRDFTLGPVAHFGGMSRTTGCGCIENGQLRRVMLSAELESAADANLFLRSASYGRIEWSLTPSVSTLEIAGNMYLTILGASNAEVSGLASFTVDRDKDFVEGLIDGKFSSGTALGLNSVTADGQLNWHLGSLGGESYQSLQGRLAVQVVAPSGGAGVEGGFYIGVNAPKSEAWVLAGAGQRFKLNMAPLPDRLTGAYGYAKATRSVNLFVFSGGVEAYAGVGAFVLTPAQVVDLHAVGSGLGPGLPFVIGHVGIHVWGEILGGLVSASGTADLEVIGPYPFSFDGTLELEGCALWVACASVDVSIGLNTTEGLYVR